MFKKLKKNTAHAIIGTFLVMVAASVDAATFSFSDPNCTGYTMTAGVISCSGTGGQPTSVPVCTPSPTLATTTVGMVQLFNANCTNSPTSYSWKVDNGTAIGAATQSTYTTATTLGLGPHTVSVIATNGVGPSVEASASLNVQAVAQVPACTISPQVATAPVGASKQFTASCNNSPTTYTWTVDDSVVPLATSASYSTATTLVAGNHTVAVSAKNSIGTSTNAGASLVIQTVATCAQINTNRAINLVTDRGQNIHLGLNRGQSLSLQFTTGTTGQVGSLMTDATPEFVPVTKFINISTSQCDFSYTQVNSKSPCASSLGVLYSVGVAGTASCVLQPNTTYYMNVRNENPSIFVNNKTGGVIDQRGIDTCPVGSLCGFIFQVQ